MAPNSLQQLPTYKNVIVDDVKTPDYQRILRDKKVQKILKKFHPAKVRPPLVNDHGDGTYTTIDGQHTLAVLKKMGYTKVPMAVVRIPIEEENDHFSTQHDDKDSISPMERLWSDSKGNNGRAKRAQDILNAIEAAGWQYTRDKTVHGPEIVTVSGGTHNGVEWTYDYFEKRRGNGFTALQDTLETIHEAWPKHARAAEPSVAAAMGKLLYEYELTSSQVEALGTLDLSDMMHRQKGKGGQATKRDAYAEAFRKHLNSKCSGAFTARGIFRKQR